MTLADRQMQQEQALPQQLEKEAADMQACVLKQIGTHEQDLRQDHRLEQEDHRLVKASMTRNTGYGVCFLQQNVYRHLSLLYIIIGITTIWMEPLIKLCESIQYKRSLV